MATSVVAIAHNVSSIPLSLRARTFVGNGSSASSEVTTTGAKPITKTRRSRSKKDIAPAVPTFQSLLMAKLGISTDDASLITQGMDHEEPEPWRLNLLRDYACKLGLFKDPGTGKTSNFKSFGTGVQSYRVDSKEVFPQEQKPPLNYTNLVFDLMRHSVRMHLFDGGHTIQEVFADFAVKHALGASSRKDPSRLTPSELLTVAYHLNAKPGYNGAMLRIGKALGIKSRSGMNPYLSALPVSESGVASSLKQLGIPFIDKQKKAADHEAVPIIVTKPEPRDQLAASA